MFTNFWTMLWHFIFNRKNISLCGKVAQLKLNLTRFSWTHWRKPWTGMQTGKLNQSVNIANHTQRFGMNRRKIPHLLIRSDVFETIWKIDFSSQWDINIVRGNWLGFMGWNLQIGSCNRGHKYKWLDLSLFFIYKSVRRKIISSVTTKQIGCWWDIIPSYVWLYHCYSNICWHTYGLELLHNTVVIQRMKRGSIIQ